MRFQIPPELRELITVIAYHLHETWAAEKIRQGYSFGAVRDDKLKRKACAMPVISRR